MPLEPLIKPWGIGSGKAEGAVAAALRQRLSKTGFAILLKKGRFKREIQLTRKVERRGGGSAPPAAFQQGGHHKAIAGVIKGVIIAVAIRVK